MFCLLAQACLRTEREVKSMPWKIENSVLNCFIAQAGQQKLDLATNDRHAACLTSTEWLNASGSFSSKIWTMPVTKINFRRNCDATSHHDVVSLDILFTCGLVQGLQEKHLGGLGLVICTIGVWCCVRSPRAPREKPRGSASYTFTY